MLDYAVPKSITLRFYFTATARRQSTKKILIISQLTTIIAYNTILM